MKAEEEIEVVEHMLDILRRCLIISIRNRRIKESKTILGDMKIVRLELKKIREKQALGDSTKEK